MILDDIGAENLIHGIVNQAINDYKRWLKETIKDFQKGYKNREAKWLLHRLDIEWHSDWMRDLGTNPDYFVPKIRNIVYKELLESGKITANELVKIISSLNDMNIIEYHEMR